MSEQLNDGLNEVYSRLPNQNRSFRSTSNSQSGVGSSRDPGIYTSVNPTAILTYEEGDNLFRSSTVLYNLVTRLPEQVFENFSGWDFAGVDDMDSVLAADFTSWLEERGFWESLLEACVMARLTGDGFLVMGLVDGHAADEPVEGKLKDIDFFIPKSQVVVKPIGRYVMNPEHFYVTKYTDDARDSKLEGFKIHNDRILRIPGKRLYGETLRAAGGLNDSVIQPAYQAFCDWEASNADARNMMSQHSLFAYGVKGLAAKSSKQDANSLQNRFLSIMMGMNVMKGLPYDKDMEDVSFISRNFSGVDSLLEQAREVLLAACDLPKYVLLQSTSGTAFSESGLSERLAFEQIVQRYQKLTILPIIKKLIAYCTQVKGCPIYGKKNIVPVFNSSIVLSDLEQAVLYEQLSRADAAYIASGVLTPQTVALSRFGGDSLGMTIQLRDEDLEERQAAPTKSNSELDGSKDIVSKEAGSSQ